MVGNADEGQCIHLNGAKNEKCTSKKNKQTKKPPKLILPIVMEMQSAREQLPQKHTDINISQWISVVSLLVRNGSTSMRKLEGFYRMVRPA